MTMIGNRRILAAAAALCLVGAVTWVLPGCEEATMNTNSGLMPLRAATLPGNSGLYKTDGSLDAEACKEAYREMMRSFGYPVPAVLNTDEFWVCDFLQADMANLGMGGIFWVNEHNTYTASGAKAYKGKFKDEKFGYLGHEIYLLPGQVLPEHRHIGGTDGYGPKMEAWHVRHGSVEFFGEYKGAGDETLISEMPAAEQPWGFGQDWFKSKFVAKRGPGQRYKLVDPESWHFQRAGPNGAIVSEYATYHNHVEFSKPGMTFNCTKAKK